MSFTSEYARESLMAESPALQDGMLRRNLEITLTRLPDMVESEPIANGWSARAKSHSTPCQARITAYALGIKQ